MGTKGDSQTCSGFQPTNLTQHSLQR